MKSNATVKAVSKVNGRNAYFLTWTVDDVHPLDMSRMVCHVRSALCRAGITNAVQMTPGIAREVNALVTLRNPKVDANVLATRLAESFI